MTFSGVIQDLASLGVHADLVSDLPALDIEGVAQSAAPFSFSNSSSVIVPGRIFSAMETPFGGAMMERDPHHATGILKDAYGKLTAL